MHTSTSAPTSSSRDMSEGSTIAQTRTATPHASGTRPCHCQPDSRHNSAACSPRVLYWTWASLLALFSVSLVSPAIILSTGPVLPAMASESLSETRRRHSSISGTECDNRRADGEVRCRKEGDAGACGRCISGHVETVRELVYRLARDARNRQRRHERQAQVFHGHWPTGVKPRACDQAHDIAADLPSTYTPKKYTKKRCRPQ